MAQAKAKGASPKRTAAEAAARKARIKAARAQRRMTKKVAAGKRAV